MFCFKCSGVSKVLVSEKEGNRVYRHRECTGCGRRWYTEEIENSDPRVSKALNRIRDGKKKVKLLRQIGE